LTTVCIYPAQIGFGGPAAFAGRLGQALQTRGIAVSRNPINPAVSAVLVIGGTRRVDLLWRARQRGVRIVQRLNGMNWLHRRTRTGMKHFLRAEINNAILAVIRARLAGRIIYQSRFSQDWWNKVRGPAKASSTIIYNGIDLKAYTPAGGDQPPSDRLRLLLVEGRLGAGGMHTGLENALALLDLLNTRSDPLSWELAVAGEVPAALRTRSEGAGRRIHWLGVVPKDKVPALDRSAHVLFSADINAACPNSVIEALACGLPVAAYATGALPEMIAEPAGLVAPYGADHWRLEKSDPAPLADAVQRICREQEKFRPGARARAESMFDIEQVVEEYLAVLLG
jgi:glycosyltransferase involved in cell wall biosynthesis